MSGLYLSYNRPMETMESHHLLDFRNRLLEELVRRCQENPRYSLRAFAASLEMDPSFLSKILSGRRKVGAALMQKLIDRVGLPSPRVNSSSRQVSSMIEGLRVRRNAFKGKKPVNTEDLFTVPLDLDEYHMLADWYHFAILELMELNNFNPSPIWISKVLGINIHEVRAGIERLVRLGFLDIQDDGSWKLLKGSSSTFTKKGTSFARKKLQREVLKKSMAALDEIPYNQRDHSCVVLAMDSSQMDEVKQLIMDFRKKLTTYLTESPKKDRVCYLAVSLFPVSKKV